MDDGLLHVGEHTFDPDDLTYAEQRAVKRVIRNDIWDEDVDGPFEWEEVTQLEIIPATTFVFLQRLNPEVTLKEALAYKPRDVLPEDDEDTLNCGREDCPTLILGGEHQRVQCLRCERSISRDTLDPTAAVPESAGDEPAPMPSSPA
jgi:hypothetical protein